MALIKNNARVAGQIAVALANPDNSTGSDADRDTPKNTFENIPVSF